MKNNTGNILNEIEKILNYIVIFYISSCIYPFLNYLGIGTMESKIKLIVSAIMFNSLLLILLIEKQKGVIKRLKGLSIYICIFIVILISICQSINRLTSTESAIYLILTTIYSIYLYLRYPLKKIHILFLNVLSMITFMSILVILFIPEFGINPDGYWKGIYSTKNEFGRYMILQIIFAAYYSKKYYINTKKISKYNVFMFISLLNLVMSGNTSSIILLLAIAFMNKLLKLNKLSQVYGLILFIILSFILFIVNIDKLSFLFDIIGKDPTLTGRTIIWDISIDRIKESLWFGYGYRSSWDISYMKNFSYYRNFMVNAHNGFLELTLEIGIVGSLMYFINLIYSVCRNSVYFRYNKSDDIGIIFILWYIFLSNFTESFTIQSMSIFWVIQVIAFIGIKNKYFNGLKKRMVT